MPGYWMHCGQVKDGKFLEGRKVSMNRSEALLKLSNQKWLADGSVLDKIELFSENVVDQYILKDGQRIGTLIPRLNLCKDPQNWLSMQPEPLRCIYSDYDR